MKVKTKVKADFCKVNVFIKEDDGKFIEAGYKWMNVRHNAAIPQTHRMFK